MNRELPQLQDDGKLNENITREKREHPIWLNWKRIQESNPTYFNEYFRKTSILGHWQYIYKSKKGQISLVELPNYFLDGVDYWEICGSMTPDGDVERFDTKEEAEVRIKKLLS